MTNKIKFGKLGEDLACDYLKSKKYKIIERNYLKPWGELDIVALAPDKTLVIFEVKAIQQSGNAEELNPEEQMTFAKMRKLKRTASLYAGSHQELIKDQKGWRIDLLALTMKEEDFVIKHYENITQ